MEMFKAEDVADLKAKNAFIIDVRQPEERLGGRAIEDTLNIPMGDLAQRLGELPSKDDVIHVYCESGMRSQQACLFLETKGYKTSNLQGGYRAYHQYHR